MDYAEKDFLVPHLVQNSILIPQIAELLREGKEVRFTPTGVSMRPFIEGGCDTVVLRLLAEVRVGDITLCDLGGTYVLHRVIAVDSEHQSLTMRGDGNLRGTETCALDKVLGTVVRIETPNGWRKPLTRGWLWNKLFRYHWLLLKVYRHSMARLYQRRSNSAS